MASYLEETRVLANQGDAKARYSLGSIYDEGDGVPEDNARANEWYTKSAKQGDTTYQSNLGITKLGEASLGSKLSAAAFSCHIGTTTFAISANFIYVRGIKFPLTSTSPGNLNGLRL